MSDGYTCPFVAKCLLIERNNDNSSFCQLLVNYLRKQLLVLLYYVNEGIRILGTIHC